MVNPPMKLWILLLICVYANSQSEHTLVFTYILTDEGPTVPMQIESRISVSNWDMIGTRSVPNGAIPGVSGTVFEALATTIKAKYTTFPTIDSTDDKYNYIGETPSSKDSIRYLASKLRQGNPNLAPFASIDANSDHPCNLRDAFHNMLQHGLPLFHSSEFNALQDALRECTSREVTVANHLEIVKDLMIEKAVFPSGSMPCDITAIVTTHKDVLLKSSEANLGKLDQEITMNGFNLGEEIRKLRINKPAALHLEEIRYSTDCGGNCQLKYQIVASNAATINSVMMALNLSAHINQLEDYLPSVGKTFIVEVYKKAGDPVILFNVARLRNASAPFEDLTQYIPDCPSTGRCNFTTVFMPVLNKFKAEAATVTCAVTNPSLYIPPSNAQAQNASIIVLSDTGDCDCNAVEKTARCQRECAFNWLVCGSVAFGVVVLVILLIVFAVCGIPWLRSLKPDKNTTTWLNKAFKIGVSGFVEEHKELKAMKEGQKDKGSSDSYDIEYVGPPGNRSMFIVAKAPTLESPIESIVNFWKIIISEKIENILVIQTDGFDKLLPKEPIEAKKDPKDAENDPKEAKKNKKEAKKDKKEAKKGTEAKPVGKNTGMSLLFKSQELVIPEGQTQMTTLELKWSKGEKDVHIYQINVWPENQIPEEPTMIGKVLDELPIKKKNPLLVLSTDGVSRPEVLIATKIMIDGIRKGKKPSVKSVVEDLRKQRPNTKNLRTFYLTIPTGVIAYFLSRPPFDDDKDFESKKTEWMADYTEHTKVNAEVSARDEEPGQAGAPVAGGAAPPPQ